MDSAVTPSRRHPGLSLVSSTDFFYPLIDDPLVMGRIAAANVLSDVYAMGVSEVDTVLMILAGSTDMPHAVRMTVTRLLMEGFAAHCALAGTSLQGGQSVLNPWPTIGGTATALVADADIRLPVHAVAGDVLLLTKPLGIQTAVNLKQWGGAKATEAQREKLASLATLSPPWTRHDTLYAYHAAVDSMCALNRTAAQLLHSHQSHAATDVTGFGILGHADQLSKLQRAPVSYVIHTLPVLGRVMEVSDRFNMGLRQGTAAETSGGLLVALEAGRVEAFRAEYREREGREAWVVGDVVAGKRGARLLDDVRVVEV